MDFRSVVCYLIPDGLAYRAQNEEKKEQEVVWSQFC